MNSATNTQNNFPKQHQQQWGPIHKANAKGEKWQENAARRWLSSREREPRRLPLHSNPCGSVPHFKTWACLEAQQLISREKWREENMLACPFSLFLQWNVFLRSVKWNWILFHSTSDIILRHTSAPRYSGWKALLYCVKKNNGIPKAQS